MYELFLDEEGKKISKSKGNGITIEQWLRYGPPEIVELLYVSKPRKAKRLYFDVIPRAVDDYQTFLEKFEKEEPAKQLDNPVWHIHGGKPPNSSESIPGFNLLLNLAGVANAEDPKVLWGFITHYMPNVSPQTHPFLDQLVKGAVQLLSSISSSRRKNTACRPMLKRRRWTSWRIIWKRAPETVTAEALQTEIYEIGKAILRR